MDWLEGIRAAIGYIEAHLTDELTVDDIAKRAYSSSAHFGRVFHIVTGVAVHEYVRARRLSLAGRELALGEQRVIDAAMKYRYDTQESFSKAFSRFHGIPPSEAKRNRGALKYFHPFEISVIVKGGFAMPEQWADKFCWVEPGGDAQDAHDAYQSLVNWAIRARGTNPRVFDELTGWLLDDAEWTRERIAENAQILFGGVFARFLEQNQRLRERLTALRPAGCVNDAAFAALDRFDAALEGHTTNDSLAEIARIAFQEPMRLTDRDVRERFAGGRTGPSGTDAVRVYGYLNELKDLDAGVQWALFMPGVVERQQQGFRVERFAYRRMPALRFIGKPVEDVPDDESRRAVFAALDGLNAYRSDLDSDLLLGHHNGKGVDVEPWHGLWGRLMKAGAPVPEGFACIDFAETNDGKAGAPYLSQFAYAEFSGDRKAMHAREGFDDSAMYDVTRNIMLGQGVCIPYPHKYWTAEAFPDGIGTESCAYLFSAELE